MTRLSDYDLANETPWERAARLEKQRETQEGLADHERDRAMDKKVEAAE